MWLGLALGGMASLFLALSYTFSGMSVRRCKDVGTFGLLCRAHVVMGVLSLIGLPFIWTPTLATHFGDEPIADRDHAEDPGFGLQIDRVKAASESERVASKQAEELGL